MKTTERYGADADRALSMWVKLARAYTTFNKQTHNQIREFGLTQPQFAVLDCLGHLGPMQIGDLSKKMLVSGGNMTCVVDNLEREGLVHRRHSSEDRRTVVVELTKKGAELFEQIFPEHAKYITQLASVLDTDEQEQLSDLLKKLGLKLQSLYYPPSLDGEPTVTYDQD